MQDITVFSVSQVSNSRGANGSLLEQWVASSLPCNDLTWWIISFISEDSCILYIQISMAYADPRRMTPVAHFAADRRWNAFFNLCSTDGLLWVRFCSLLAKATIRALIFNASLDRCCWFLFAMDFDGKFQNIVSDCLCYCSRLEFPPSTSSLVKTLCFSVKKPDAVIVIIIVIVCPLCQLLRDFGCCCRLLTLFNALHRSQSV